MKAGCYRRRRFVVGDDPEKGRRVPRLALLPPFDPPPLFRMPPRRCAPRTTFPHTAASAEARDEGGFSPRSHRHHLSAIRRLGRSVGWRWLALFSRTTQSKDEVSAC